MSRTSLLTTSSETFSGSTSSNISTISLIASSLCSDLYGRYIIDRESPYTANEKAELPPRLVCWAMAACGCKAGSRAKDESRIRRLIMFVSSSDVAPGLLTFAVLDHLLNLLLHRFEIERRRVLHRRIINRRQRQLLNKLLDLDEAPELPSKEVVAVAEAASVRRLTANIWRTLERVLAKVDQPRHIGRGLLARPAPGLRVECELEVVDAKRTQLRAAEVEDFLALGWAFTGEKIHLVVTVEMVLVGPFAELHALQQLIGDVGVARRSHQGGEPIEAGDDSVLDAARLDHARPANDRRHAEAALANGTLGVFERRHAAIRPGEYLRTVVRGEDDDGVVGLADVVEMLQQCADAVIQLCHAGFLKTEVRLAVLHRAVLLRQERPDVHARGVVPDEERLP